MTLIKFKPLLKSTLWGGNKIAFMKGLADAPAVVGESWEVSGVPGSESVVAFGEYEGLRLNDLLCRLGAGLVGEHNYKRYGNVFPLLVKFIDASKHLSIQVHPNDDYARQNAGERGKTEMWYVMNSDANAQVNVGLKYAITPEEYRNMVENDTITDALCQYNVKEGDVFYLPAGRIHSIGAGCFLAEVQETSDLTYRIYDYKRKDKDGNYRKLHTKEASECIDFSVQDDYRVAYNRDKKDGSLLVGCHHFKTLLYETKGEQELDFTTFDSFVTLIGLSGTSVVTDDDGNEATLNVCDTVLVPASTKRVKIKGSVKFLLSYIPEE